MANNQQLATVLKAIKTCGREEVDFGKLGLDKKTYYECVVELTNKGLIKEASATSNGGGDKNYNYLVYVNTAYLTNKGESFLKQYE